jgi:basic amino acid/polyamine antiporter, APA family
LLLGTATVILLYLGLNALFLYAAAPAHLADSPQHFATLVMSRLFGPTGGRVLSTLVALILLSSVSSMILIGPRVYLAMAQDGLFFRLFARRDRHGTPAAAVLLQGTLSVLMLVATPFDALMTYVGFTLGVFAVLTVAAAVVLRVRRPDLARPYRAWAFPVTAFLFSALSLWMIVLSISERPTVAVAGLATLGTGLMVHAFFRRRARM